MPDVNNDHLDRTGNLLLARLPEVEWQKLHPNLQPVTLASRDVLYERHHTIEHVYFPRRGCVSLVVAFEDGFQAEAGLVGQEGMVGVPLIHGIRSDIVTAQVQIAAEALRMPAAVFARIFGDLPALERLLLRYSEAMRAQAMQLAGCNGHHNLETRLARCILSLQDRCGGRELPVTHEALAGLLSAHRPSISVAAKRLQSAGLIRYATGHLLVADRPGLEDAACECYRIIRNHVQWLLK